MPDFRNFEIDVLTTQAKLVAPPYDIANVAQGVRIIAPADQIFDMPILRVQTEIADSQTTEALLNLRAGNGVRFAVRVEGFGIQQHRELVEQVASWLIYKRLENLG